MGFNRRKMEADHKAEADAAARRFDDADCLIAAWNERQAKRMMMRPQGTMR
jgi:hypothetical protein